jgi:hypothetical protein
MTDAELKELAQHNRFPDEHMDLLVNFGRKVLMARRQFDLELQTMNIRAAIKKEREAIAQSLDKQADLAADEIDRQWAQEMAAAVRARGQE